MKGKEEVELLLPRHIADIPIVIKTFKFSQHLTCTDQLMMEIQIIIVLHVYLGF